MHIAISGGTGLVGSALTEQLLSNGHAVSILTRNAENKQNSDPLNYVEWLNDENRPEEALKDVDAIVNLAGASISKLWTKKHKKAILNSRIEATRECVRLLHVLSPQPKLLVNASAVGYYGLSKTDTFTEESEPAEANFLQEVCEQWENEAILAEEAGVRTVFTRFGLILDPESGAFPLMVMPYKLMVGGPVGSGEQWYSWVHLADVVGFISYVLTQPQARGPYNVTAPHPEKMKHFGQQIAKTLGRPHWFPAPAFALRTGLGEMSDLIVEGQKVIPKKTEEIGYQFDYPEFKQAAEELLSDRTRQ